MPRGAAPRLTGHELVLEVLALVIGIALVLATGLALLAAAAAGLLTTAQNAAVRYSICVLGSSSLCWCRLDVVASMTRVPRTTMWDFARGREDSLQ